MMANESMTRKKILKTMTKGKSNTLIPESKPTANIKSKPTRKAFILPPSSLIIPLSAVF